MMEHNDLKALLARTDRFATVLADPADALTDPLLQALRLQRFLAGLTRPNQKHDTRVFESLRDLALDETPLYEARLRAKGGRHAS